MNDRPGTTPEGSVVDAGSSATRDQLPSREMVFAIDDVEALQDLLDYADARARHIEADLEFRSDGDLEWERRARGALAAHNICIGHIGRRLRQLTPKATPKTPKGGTPEHITAKAMKIEAAAKRVLAEKEAAVQRAEKVRLAAAKEALRFAERTSWLAHFHQAAADLLDGATMSRLSNTAHAATRRALAGPFEAADGSEAVHQ